MEVDEETVQHLHGVRDLLEVHKHVEQTGKGRIIPEEEPSVIGQGPYTLPAFGTDSTLGGPLLCLKLSEFSTLRFQFFFESLGTQGGTFITGHECPFL